MATEYLADRVRRLRRQATLTQEGLAEQAGVSVDTIRRLEQKPHSSVRLPTLHALASGLGVELTSLVGDPPGAPSTGESDSPQLVAVRRAIMPPLFAPPAPPGDLETLTLERVRRDIAGGWTLYHAAAFEELLSALPGLITDARAAATVGDADQRAAGQAALSKALQLGGHLAIRMGKTDLALSSLERAIAAADASSDPLLAPMISNSVAWAYQRQARLDDARGLAVHAADRVERDHSGTPEGMRVWGGLLMSAATSHARSGDYERASDMMVTAEKAAERLARMPKPQDGKLLSVFNKSSVRIERVRLAVQHERPSEALTLARGMRLSKDTPPSWRTWLLLDVARAHTDLGNGVGAVKALESLKRNAPAWMRHHTLAVAVVRDLRNWSSRPTGLKPIAEFLGVAD
ncbi:helix-turn-helix transcriptional regulator [Streptomyces malaysiensis]|uniref:helix-turn-helix transcriptional regulator n=1 Tax=Streptomyces malaysiensis TaxID=92644 RepID=UPI002B2E8E81|nr:helix-turn-helix transcriptional regulator [Streptomyces malaysiensis]